MRYVVNLGFGDSDRYEFKDGAQGAAWNFAEMAAVHRVDKTKKVEVEVYPEPSDYENDDQVEEEVDDE